MESNQASIDNDQFVPNVFEVHTHAIYINVPVLLEDSEPLRKYIDESKMEFDVDERGIIWISILIDDLTFFRLYAGKMFDRFLALPAMTGYQCKVNFLVKRKGLGDSTKGYQIRTIDFCSSQPPKIWGCKISQQVPTYGSEFHAHGFDSLNTASSDESLRKVSVRVKTISSIFFAGDGGTDCTVSGVVSDKEPTAEERLLMEFIATRPYKYLKQSSGNVTIGLAHDNHLKHHNYGIPRSHAKIDGCRVLLLDDDTGIRQLLSNRLPGVAIPPLTKYDGSSPIDGKSIFCFYQPEYNILDHNNISI